MKKETILFIAFLFISFCLKASGYNISVQINGLENSTVYLGNYYGESYFLNDTITLDHKGAGTFSGTEKLPGGLYMVVLPDKNYFIIMLDKDQHFNIKTDTAGYIDHMAFEGSEMNQAFLDYQQFMIKHSQEKQLLQSKLTALGDDDSLKIKNISQAIDTLEQSIEHYKRSVIIANDGNFLSKYLRATQSPSLPKSLTEKGPLNMENILRLYQYKKDHYFDHIDLTDSRFLRSPILHQKLDQYFNQVLNQQPDTIIKGIDYIASYTADNDEVYKYVLSFLFRNYHNKQAPVYKNIYVYLIENYYLAGKAPWVSQALKEKLRMQVEKIKGSMNK